MRQVQQHPLYFPDISWRQSPVVVADLAQICDRVTRDPAREIDVRVDVAQGQRSRRGKHRFTPVQSRITRSSDRSPPAVLTIDEEDVIQLVDRFKRHDERRPSMLLEDYCRRQGGFKTMRAVMIHD